MKKIYSQPEWTLLIVEEDVITASGDFLFDPEDLFNDGNSGGEDWEW